MVRAGTPLPPEMPMEITHQLRRAMKFRAYDKATGEVVWEIELPAGVTGAPITYMFEGKQYVIVPIGSADHDPEWVALSLP